MHSINLRKLAKPAVLFISALFIISILSAFLTTAVQATTSTTALHISGNQVLTANGTPLDLKGMDYTYFLNSENGSWMMPDGSIKWATWSTRGVSDFLNFMQASNATVVRCYLTVQYWLDNSNNYQSNLEYFITQAANRGIYTDLVFYRNNATDSEPDGFLPWNDAGNNVLNSSADFVNLWGNVSTTLKSYPTVMFELWNEPTGNEATWFGVAQQCINDIRSTGATQPIVIQWDDQINYNFYAGYSGSVGDVSGMSWVFNYSLNDPLGNLIYSTHIYSSTGYGIYNSSTNSTVTDYPDILYALSQTDVLAVAAVHPVFIGEIGDDLWGNTTDQDIFFNNTLTLLDDNNIGYAGFAAPPWTSATEWGLVESGVSNYTLNDAGVILVNHLGGMTYTDWLSLQQSTSPWPIIALAAVSIIVVIAFGAYTYTKRSKK